MARPSLPVSFVSFALYLGRADERQDQ